MLVNVDCAATNRLDDLWVCRRIYLGGHGEAADCQVARWQVGDEDVDTAVDRSVPTARQYDDRHGVATQRRHHQRNQCTDTLYDVWSPDVTSLDDRQSRLINIH